MSKGTRNELFSLYNQNQESIHRRNSNRVVDPYFTMSSPGEQVCESSPAYNTVSSEIVLSQEELCSYNTPRSRRDDYSGSDLLYNDSIMNINSISPQDMNMGVSQLRSPYLQQSYNVSRVPPGVQIHSLNPARHRYNEYIHPNDSFSRLTIPSQTPRGSYPNSVYHAHSPYAYSPYDMYAHEEPMEAIPSPRFKMPQASYLGNSRRNPFPDVSTNWRMKGNHQKKGKKSRSDKKNAGNEREADQPSIQYIHREIENNRGNLISLATQQQGCRHLQLAIEQDGMRVVEMLYEELSDHMPSLMSDPFGNYLFQELVEMSSEEQLLSLIQIVKSTLCTAAKDTHGTRCVQKLIQICRHPEGTDLILDGLCPFIVDLSSDINGNHVIKRCMMSVTASQKERLFSSIIDHCIEISKAVYGCCVVQKCIELATGSQRERLLTTIQAHSVELMKHSCANYVIQFLIENSAAAEADLFCQCVLNHVEELSKEKCSSNVVEKSLKLGSAKTRDRIIQEIIQSKDILSLLLDNYANYVIQKAILLSNYQQRESLKSIILPFAKELSEHKVGKHVLVKIQNPNLTRSESI